MASYKYVVINQKGKKIKGTIEAQDDARAIALLKADGLIPLTVTEQSVLDKDINITIGNPIKPRDLSVFCRQFTSILGAGVTVISALQMLSEQTEKKEMKSALKEVMAGVEKGETLSGSMSLKNKIFPGILVNMVEAGEASGSLDIAFERMAAHFEKEAKLKALVRQAMIYPIVICLVAIAAIVVMMTVVVPNFTGMFEEIGTQLPPITLFVVGISNFIVDKWWLLLIIVILVVSGFTYFRKTPVGSVFLGNLALKLPLFGALTIKASSARLMRTLSTLIAAGIPLIDAVDIAGRTMDNVIIKQYLMETKEEVSRGIPLSEPLERSGIFPPMVYHMTRIGENTGNMEEMMDKVADYYDEEVEAATKALTTVLEPLIIIILAMIVGVIIAAVMSPMLDLYNNIENA